MKLQDIDVNFDFTTDTPHYWDNYWDRYHGLGRSIVDPDSKSKTLREYHRLLWSKPLPNGQVMDLGPENSRHLQWNDTRFGSDSIIASFRYESNYAFIQTVADSMPDFKAFFENYSKRSHTIGGNIIFPKMKGGMNQSRGCNKLISDRFDLTLECIRRWYLGIESPLSDVIDRNRCFFELFVDFKGYVEFFFLQDLVDENYENVRLWHNTEFFVKNPIPHTISDYLSFIQNELEFVGQRNKRVRNYIQTTQD